MNETRWSAGERLRGRFDRSVVGTVTAVEIRADGINASTYSICIHLV